MDALPIAFLYACLLAACLILVALVAIVLCERKLLGQGGKDLLRALRPFAVALLVWPFFRWPSSHLWDQTIFVFAFALVLLGIGWVCVFIVRTLRPQK